MRKRKTLLLAVALFAVTMGIGSTLAYLTAETNEIVNTFIPGTVPPSIQEEFDGTSKRNVQIENDGNISAYVRAFAVISWKDSQGNLAPDVPAAGRDYTILWSDSGWQKEGEYYYCLNVIEPQKLTPVLIREVIQKKEKQGYDLVVEIITQTIQSQGSDCDGKTPMELAWGVVIENGVLRPVSNSEGGVQ